MSEFQWPETWPLAGDRTSYLFSEDWYDGLGESTKKDAKTFRVWFDDKSKHTLPLANEKTWKILRRNPKRKASLYFGRRACARIYHICFACVMAGQDAKKNEGKEEEKGRARHIWEPVGVGREG